MYIYFFSFQQNALILLYFFHHKLLVFVNIKIAIEMKLKYCRKNYIREEKNLQTSLMFMMINNADFNVVLMIMIMMMLKILFYCIVLEVVSQTEYK